MKKGVILIRINEQTHDSRASKIEANDAVCRIKKRAVETMEHTSTIINECVIELSQVTNACTYN